MVTQSFDFTGAEGQHLSGVLDLPDGPISSYVLFVHCFTCTKTSLAASQVSHSLTALGYAVLRFDFTGLGQSGGSFADSSFSGDIADVIAAADAMRRAGHAPRLLVGHSLGGAATLAAAAHIPEVKALATIGAPVDVAHVAPLLTDEIEALGRKGEAEVKIGDEPFLMRRSFFKDLASHDHAGRIRALRKPLLVMHSPQDRIVSIDSATTIYTAAFHPKSFISLDGADHMLTNRQDADFAATMIASWASRYLATPAPARSDAQSGGCDCR